MTAPQNLTPQEQARKHAESEGDNGNAEISFLAGYEAGHAAGRADALREAVIAINAVQSAIAGYQFNSSEMLSGVKAAWNINAKFLSNNFDAQSEYLNSCAAGDPK